MSIEFTIDGLNAKQRALADIMWALDGYDQVQALLPLCPCVIKKNVAQSLS